MSKKNATKSSAGTTANPAPQPTAAASQAPARAQGKPTAGPAPEPATNAVDHEREAFAELEAALSIGSEGKQPTPKAAKPKQELHAIPEDDETPVNDEAVAEDSNQTGEETAPAEALAGETESPTEPTETEAPAGEPAAENETEPETPAEEPIDLLRADDEALDALAATKRWPKSVTRRIKGMRKHLETIEARANAEIETLRAENEQLKASPQAAAAATVPVTDAEAQLTAKIAKFENVLDAIDDNPNGMTTQDGREWTAAELRRERRNYERQLREAEAEIINVRQARKARGQQVEAVLPVQHPALKDRTSPQALHVDALLREYPVLRSDPFFKLVLADAVAWRLSRKPASSNGTTNGTGNGNGNGSVNGNGHHAPPAPKPAPRPPGAPGRPAALPQPVNGQRAQLGAMEQRFMESGDPDAGKALIASLLPHS